MFCIKMNPYFSIGRRLFSSHSENQTLLWIHGANSHIAQHARIKAIYDKNIHIISAQRNKPTEEIAKFKNHRFVLLNSDDTYNADKLEKLIEPLLETFNGTIIFLNAIGGAHPAPNSSLRQLNTTSALSFAEAINRVMQKKRNITSILIQLSSIAAAFLTDEYGSVKKETDENLLANYDNIDHILCFRVGYVVQSLLEGGIVKDSHDFNPEQLAKYFPFQPIVKDGENENRIYPVHMQDIVSAILNSSSVLKSEKKVRQIVNIVGSEGYTQRELLKFYTEQIFKKQFRPLEIPLEAFIELATNLPHGHIALYAAEYIRLKETKLDEQFFKELLKREPTSIQEIGKEIKDPSDAVVPNPIFPFLNTVITRIYQKKISLQTALKTPLNFITLTFKYNLKHWKTPGEKGK